MLSEKLPVWGTTSAITARLGTAETITGMWRDSDTNRGWAAPRIVRSSYRSLKPKCGRILRSVSAKPLAIRVKRFEDQNHGSNTECLARNARLTFMSFMQTRYLKKAISR